MNSSRSVLIAIFAISSTLMLFTLSSALSTSECDKILVESDKCYTKILGIGDRNFTRVMRSEKDVQIHCKAIKNNLKCFKNYGKCMKSLPKTMFNIIYTGARKEVTLRCESSEARNDFQSMSSTLGPKIHLDRIVEKLTNFFDYTVSNVTKNDQLSYLCCGYHYFNDEMYTAILGSSTESNAKYVKRSVSNLFADLMDFTCGEFPSVEVCKKKLPASRKSYEKSKPFDSFYTHGVFVPLALFEGTYELNNSKINCYFKFFHFFE